MKLNPATLACTIQMKESHNSKDIARDFSKSVPLAYALDHGMVLP
jgi:hypothetical protein